MPPDQIRRSAFKFLSSISFYPKDASAAEAIERQEVRMWKFASDLVRREFVETPEVIKERRELGDAIAFGTSILFQPGGAADEDASDLAAVVFRRLKDLRGAEVNENWTDKAAQLRKRVMEDVGLEPTLRFFRTWVNFISQAEAIEQAPDFAFVRARRTILVIVNYCRKICVRLNSKLGDLPNKIKDILTRCGPYLIGAYIKLINTESYLEYRKILIKACVEVRTMDLS
jgi:hypothetical protein